MLCDDLRDRRLAEDIPGQSPALASLQLAGVYGPLEQERVQQFPRSPQSISTVAVQHPAPYLLRQLCDGLALT